METITEDYCSFEVAKLLKEKGFDEPVTELNKLLIKEGEKPVLKITHQKAMKWLREVHKLSIEPFYMFPATWEIDIKYIDKKTDLSEFEDIRDKSYNSYEEAVEAACLYSLENLI